MIFFTRRGKAAQQYDENTILLLHGEEIVDSSMYGNAITNSGVVVSADQSKFGGKSLYLNGNSYLLIPPYDFGTADFTVDWWEYPTSASSGERFSSYAGHESSNSFSGLLLGYQGTKMYVGSGFNSWDIVSGVDMFNVNVNTWTHWAVVRSGGVLKTYKNGSLFATVNAAGAIRYDSTSPMMLGKQGFGLGTPFVGYIDEFRISDIARWTSNFTPPDKAYGGGTSSGGTGGEDEPVTCMVTITGSGGTNKCYAEVNGTVYTSPATVGVVPGTEVTLFVRSGVIDTYATITVNGQTVKSVDYNSGPTATHAINVSGNMTVHLGSSSWDSSVGAITVTTL